MAAEGGVPVCFNAGCSDIRSLSFFSPTPARGNANGISEFTKQKEKRGCYCARCLCTRHIKAVVSAAEREIKGDIARKKIDVV